MDTNQQFNTLFEQYILKVADEVISDATPGQQKAIVDLLLSIDTSSSINCSSQSASPVKQEGTVAKTSRRRFQRSASRKYDVGNQVRKGLLQLSIEQNQRQIINAITYINLLEELIVRVENTPLNDRVKYSVIASYLRVITIYSNQLNRLKDINHSLSRSVSQLV